MAKTKTPANKTLANDATTDATLPVDNQTAANNSSDVTEGEVDTSKLAPSLTREDASDTATADNIADHEAPSELDKPSTGTDPVEQLQQPQAADGTSGYAAKNADNNEDGEADDEADFDDTDDNGVAAVSTGGGTVVGNGEVQSFIANAPEAPIGGDGVTGVSNDGETYASRDGATGADTNYGEPSIGTTPVAPVPQTADALVASTVAPAKVEAEVIKVISEFVSDGDSITVGGQHNLFDDIGMNRSDLIAFAKKLNEHFGITLTVGEAQNFLLVRDVQNMVKRKIAVAAATA